MTTVVVVLFVVEEMLEEPVDVRDGAVMVTVVGVLAVADVGLVTPLVVAVTVLSMVMLPVNVPVDMREIVGGQMMGSRCTNR
jgi:hypothetical protein